MKDRQVLTSGKMQARLTKLRDGSGEEVDHVVCYEVVEGVDHSGEKCLIWDIVEGGVTGYEGYYVDIAFLNRLMDTTHEMFCLCHGTEHRWDRLEVCVKDVRDVLESFRIRAEELGNAG